MKNLKNFVFNTIVGMLLFSFMGWLPILGSVVINASGFAMHAMNTSGIAFAGLAKEIWLPDIMEQFLPNWSFLREARDMSSFVDNNTINLAEAGVAPDVLINNNTYPVPFAQRSDIPLALPLDVYDTEGTVLRNSELIELAYDKRTSVTNQHKNALNNKYAKRAAHAYCPSSDAEYTPVLATTGADYTSNGHVFKKITFNDIVDLQTKFDLLDAPEGSRVIVLNPVHANQLWMEDKLLFKTVMTNNDLFGFKIYKYSKTPVFDKDTNVKKAFEAAAAATDQIASFAFVNTEVMQAMGATDMFYRLNDPEQKGDIINFQMRGLALPIRNKYIGAIYSDFKS